MTIAPTMIMMMMMMIVIMMMMELILDIGFLAGKFLLGGVRSAVYNDTSAFASNL